MIEFLNLKAILEIETKYLNSYKEYLEDNTSIYKREIFERAILANRLVGDGLDNTIFEDKDKKFPNTDSDFKNDFYKSLGGR